MSKSLKRVKAALLAANLPINIVEMQSETKTAVQAAAACECEVDQILKSIIFRGIKTKTAILFMTAGGNQVCPDKASNAAGQPLDKADAGLIRAQTGFAIGGVAPLGHLSPITAFFDARLLDFPVIWAAAGTPRHVFSVKPQQLLEVSGAQLSDFSI